MEENVGIIVPTQFNPPLLTLLKYLKREKINPVLITYGRMSFPPPNATYIEEVLRKENIVREHVRAVRLKQDIPILFKKYKLDMAIGPEFFWLSTILFRLLTTENFYSYTYENIPAVLMNFTRFFTTISNVLYKGIIFPVSSTQKVWLEFGLEKGKTIVIPPCVDTELFKPCPNRLENRLRLLFVGRVCQAKGVDYLLAALQMIRKEIPCFLTIIGAGEIERYRILAKKMKVNNLLEFVGPVRYDLLPSYIRRANVLILPSITTKNWREQFGMVLIEAMAMGRVVIGSNSGAIPDVIGDAGIIVEEKSSSAIARVLKELWHDPSLVKTYSQKGLKRVKETYSPEIVVNKYIKLLASDKP